jgi:polyhydroxyalkanoate synthesis regulator phasin
MTNEELQQQANKIVEKWIDKGVLLHDEVEDKNYVDSAIQCAITEVESNIELLSKLGYETDFMGYKAILEHLKTM